MGGGGGAESEAVLSRGREVMGDAAWRSSLLSSSAQCHTPALATRARSIGSPHPAGSCATPVHACSTRACMQRLATAVAMGMQHIGSSVLHLIPLPPVPTGPVSPPCCSQRARRRRRA